MPEEEVTMIRQLAQCPYCHTCEIALDDDQQAVFNPGTDSTAPCAHLLWMLGRYVAWDHGPTGVPRVAWSMEFRWDHPNLAAADFEGHLREYLAELANSGKGWEFAPAERFDVVALSADEKAVDPRGKPYLRWEVDGTGLFAAAPAAFLAALPGCQERHLATLRVKPEDQQT
jgi:hypothetical protein